VQRVLRLAAITSLALAALVVGAGAAGAAQASNASPNTCTGTLKAPGVLAGTFNGTVTVRGVCFVNGGAALINGNLNLAPGSALNATFALNDLTGQGTSSLFVRGSITVGAGAVMAMGCEPNFNPCSDNPNGRGQDIVTGNVTSLKALTVLVHASRVYGSISYIGGGGGVTCAIPPTGILHALQSPAFFDAEDNFIGGNLAITGLRTCWTGALRNAVRGSVLNTNNRFADPDANEILANLIGGSVACSANVPAVQYGDSGSSPNLVRGSAFGECAFSVRQPDPAPHGPLRPISIKI
jgi:hypothetical protein